MKIIFIQDKSYKDINPLKIAYEECKPGKSFSGYPRNHTTIHYVFSGKGTLTIDGKTYHIGAGNMFTIPEGKAASHTADKDDPWVYVGIQFEGELSKDFAALPAVMPHSPELFRQMANLDTTILDKTSHFTALLFMLHAEIKQKPKQTEKYINYITEYVNTNYMNDIGVGKLAQQMNLNRHYLSLIFKKAMGKSIQEYIIHIRMKRAKEYLLEGKSVTETALLCGYTDSSTFSKMFSKHYKNIPPSKFKKRKEFFDSENKKRNILIYEE